MLFRQEAIDHHRDSLCGEVTLPVPLSVTVLTAFLAASCVMAAACLVTGSYTRKEHVYGFLVPHLGVVRIMPPRAGTVTAVPVFEGGLVRRGDALLTVSAEQVNEQGANVDAAMLGNLKQQAARLHDQILSEQQRAEAERRAVLEAADRLEAAIAALQAEQSLQAQRTVIAVHDVTASAALLARGEMSPLEQRRREDSLLAQREAGSALGRAVLDKQAELGRARSEAADIQPAARQREAALQGAEAEIDAKLSALEGQRAYVLIAPMAGRVSALQAWVGKTVDPSMPQMSIVPEGDTLQAQLMVPARAIGFVKPGEQVRLSYDAFPYQQYGFAEGRVQTISATLLKPAEMAGPLASETPAFRVTVALASQKIRIAGADITLQTDTPLQADIMLDRRSLFAWVTGPLRAAAGRL